MESCALGAVAGRKARSIPSLDRTTNLEPDPKSHAHATRESMNRHLGNMRGLRPNEPRLHHVYDG